MSLLWWQNGRDIDWFSTNLEKWIKPAVISTNSNNFQNHGGRYSKLKSCRLSRTCQTMMYVPQDQQAKDLSYEEQVATFQDNRPYKYSARQEHYNSHYNYIRTSARRAYYKPETHQIVLADEFDKIQTIQRQNRAKNYDYLLLLQQFLRNQQTKATNNGSSENIGKMTSYLSDNIQQYEQTNQTITLKQFLQEGIKKYEHEHLVTLREFLQENPSTTMSQHPARNLAVKENSTKVNGRIKEVTLKEFLKEDCASISKNLSPPNPFENDNGNIPFIAQVDDSGNKKVDNNNASIEELSFEEFLKERQNANSRLESCHAVMGKTNDVLARPLHSKDKCANGTNSPPKISFGEFAQERGRHGWQPSPIIKRAKYKSPRPKVTFALDGETKSHCIDRRDKISFDEFLKEGNDKLCKPRINSLNGASPSPLPCKVKLKDTETKSQSVDSNDIVTFDEFLKEKRQLANSPKSSSEEDKAMTLEEFLKNEPSHLDHKRLGKSNEHKAKVKNRNSLKLSKSFNDRTNMIKDNLFKKLTRNEIQNENGKKMDSREENNENKITLYEFLKEEDQKKNTTEIENCLRNLKLRSKHDDIEMFYEINNNAPEIKLNDNMIQVETEAPEMKYNQYEHNRQVCACDNQVVLGGKVCNQSYNQLLSNSTGNDRIEFVDRSYDYHRKVHQDNILSCPFQNRADNRLFNSMHVQGRRSKSKKPYVSPVRGGVEEGMYGPLWPSVLLTYDKVVSPNRIVCLNESYA